MMIDRFCCVFDIIYVTIISIKGINNINHVNLINNKTTQPRKIIFKKGSAGVLFNDDIIIIAIFMINRIFF